MRREHSGARKAWAISSRPSCRAASSLLKPGKTQMSFARAWRICGVISKLYSVNHATPIQRRKNNEMHGNRQGEQGQRKWRYAKRRIAGRNGVVQRGTFQGGHHEGWWRLETNFPRQTGPVLWRAAYRNCWPVRPDGGASRWLLDVGGQVDGRGGRMAEALPESNASGL